MITKDAGPILRRSLEALAFCREIVVVDGGSSDGTLALCSTLRSEGLPVRVIEREWTNFADQKQRALDAVKTPWALSVDSDEIVDADLREAICDWVRNPTAAAAELRRRNWYYGRPLEFSGQSPNWVRRLVRSDGARFEGAVHETLRIDGNTHRIDHGWLEHRFDSAIRTRIAKARHYSQLSAEQAFDAGKRARRSDAISTAARHFVFLFVRQSGWRDGWRGAVWDALMAYEAGLGSLALARRSQATH